MPRPCHIWLVLFWLVLFRLAMPLTAHGQWAVPYAPPMPVPPPAPVQHLRILGPQGVQATFYTGVLPARKYDCPVNIAVRPGYIYRFQLSGLPQGKDLSIYPTLEVIGALHMPPPCCADKHPTPVVINREDIDKALDGTYLIKVIVLEHPEKALPVATHPDRPIEYELTPDRDPLAEARKLGRPMLVVRFGQRQPDPEELAAQAIPGTMLMPDDKYLGAPGRAPNIPWGHVPLFDPWSGPRFPEEECLHDGGDTRLPVGRTREGLGNLDPTDTAATYADHQTRPHLTISNRVCLCVPRYVLYRSEIAPAGYVRPIAAIAERNVKQPFLVDNQEITIEKKQYDQVDSVMNQRRPAVLIDVPHILGLEQILGTGLAIGSLEGQVVVGTSRKVEPPGLPLSLCKSVDPQCVQTGDVVTFTLKYHNPGLQPISDVVISDSLTNRLEYVPGSASSDRDAVFSSRGNEAGSLILRWQISGDLLPGQTGIITFKAKIR